MTQGMSDTPDEDSPSAGRPIQNDQPREKPPEGAGPGMTAGSPPSPPSPVRTDPAAARSAGDPVNPAKPPPSNDVEAAAYQFPSMHPEGTKFVVIAVALALFFWFVVDWDILGWLTAGLAVWIFSFFRDPVRVTPHGAGKIVSPADGMVSHIMTVPTPRQLGGPEGLGEAGYLRISVFMSVFDVHINRSPVAGQVKRVDYVPGKFVNAETDKASEHNERQYFLIEEPDGTRIGITQIAGLVARRIVKFVNEGQTVRAGERIGLIRFGSRVDVYLPAGYEPQVAIGQRAVAGETILAARGAEKVWGSAQ